MKSLLYKFQMTLLIFIMCISCSKESGIEQFDSLVIEDEDNPYKLKQVTFIISILNPDYGYLNVPVIDSLNLFVNAKYWGTFSSELHDTTGKTDIIAGNLKYSNNEIEYMFIAPYQMRTRNLVTAGDYVDFLYERLVLTPGDYICELYDIKYKNNAGNWVTNTIQAYTYFSVEANITSEYIGKIEILIE